MNKTTLLFLVLPFGFLSDAFAGTWHGNKMPDWSAQKSVDKSSACNLAIWDQRSTLRFSLPVAIAPNGSVDARSSQFWDVKRTDKRISISSNRFSNWAKQDHVPMVIELDDQKRATEVSWPDFKPGANPLNPPLVYHMSYDDQGRCAIDRVQAMDNSGQKHYWVDAGLCRDLKDAKGLKERRINESSRSSEPPIDPVIESIIDKHRENIEFPR